MKFSSILWMCTHSQNPFDGAVRRMRTRIGLLAQPKSMRSTIGTTQREQRHSLLKWGTFLIRTRCK